MPANTRSVERRGAESSGERFLLGPPPARESKQLEKFVNCDGDGINEKLPGAPPLLSLDGRALFLQFDEIVALFDFSSAFILVPNFPFGSRNAVVFPRHFFGARRI